MQSLFRHDRLSFSALALAAIGAMLAAQFGAFAARPALYAGLGLYHRDIHVGSCGVVDEADLSEVALTGARANPKLTVTDGSIVLRYPIQLAFEGLGVPLLDTILFLRYKDNGAGARVRAILRAFDVGDGTTTTLLFFDSNDFPQMADYQRQNVNVTDGSIDYDAADAWYVEVTMDKTTAAGRPEVIAVEVWTREDL